MTGHGPTMAEVHTTTQLMPAGRRQVSRLRLQLPARLVLVRRNAPCLLENISRSGARIVAENPPAVGEFGQLRCEGMVRFFETVWCEGPRAGLAFDEPLPQATLVFLREFNERFPQLQRRDLMTLARRWVHGEID